MFCSSYTTRGIGWDVTVHPPPLHSWGAENRPPDPPPFFFNYYGGPGAVTVLGGGLGAASPRGWAEWLQKNYFL